MAGAFLGAGEQIAGEGPAHVRCSAPPVGDSLGVLEHECAPRVGLPRVSRPVPVAEQAQRRVQGLLAGLVGKRVSQGSPHVRVAQLDPVHPPGELRGAVGLARARGQRQEVRAVVPFDVRELITGHEVVPAIGTHALEDPEATVLSEALRGEQGDIQQGGQRLGDREWVLGLAGDLRGCREVEGADQHARPIERPLLGWVELLEGPVQRSLQGTVTIGHVGD